MMLVKIVFSVSSTWDAMLNITKDVLQLISDCWHHSHKKRKDSLETRAKPAIFSLKLEFRELLEPSSREPA